MIEDRDGSRSRRSVSEAARREQIVRAAFEVAAREGLSGVTIRAVAAEAKVSHPLVLFHFKRKDQLIHELLEWMIARDSVHAISQDIARFPRAVDRLYALLEQEMTRLAREPAHTRLFLEYWLLGARHPSIRRRLRAEMERSRTELRAILEELLPGEPDPLAGVTADGLAAAVSSWIQGCAVQAMNDPERFDAGEYLAAARGVMAWLGRGREADRA